MPDKPSAPPRKTLPEPTLEWCMDAAKREAAPPRAEPLGIGDANGFTFRNCILEPKPGEKPWNTLTELDGYIVVPREKYAALFTPRFGATSAPPVGPSEAERTREPVEVWRETYYWTLNMPGLTPPVEWRGSQVDYQKEQALIAACNAVARAASPPAPLAPETP